MATAANQHMATMPDEEFMEMFEQLGGAKMSRVTGMTQRNIYSRRRNLEKQYGVTLHAPNKEFQSTEVERTARLHHEIENGAVLIFSDAHYWPQTISTIHAAICEVAAEIQPDLIIANGDVFDGADLSRHARIGWEEAPSPADEIYACQARLAEIEQAAPKARRIWNLGNHCARFESFIANKVPELAKVNGVHLKDHFPEWETAWSTWINDEVVVKHRWHGGVHASYNNTVKSGKTIVTGHTHQLNVRPWTDYNGTRFGIECGTAAEPNGPQFLHYTEDNPKNWVSSAIVLTFHNGEMLYPEVIRRLDRGVYEFRGQVRDLGGQKTKRARKAAPKKKANRKRGN